MMLPTMAALLSMAAAFNAIAAPSASAAAAAAASISSLSSLSCKSNLDCSLNGVCTASACKCDAPWTGPACGVLGYKTTPASGKSLYPESDPHNSWNGAIIRATDDGVRALHDDVSSKQQQGLRLGVTCAAFMTCRQSNSNNPTACTHGIYMLRRCSRWTLLCSWTI